MKVPRYLARFAAERSPLLQEKTSFIAIHKCMVNSDLAADMCCEHFVSRFGLKHDHRPMETEVHDRLPSSPAKTATSIRRCCVSRFALSSKIKSYSSIASDAALIALSYVAQLLHMFDRPIGKVWLECWTQCGRQVQLSPCHLHKLKVEPTST